MEGDPASGGPSDIARKLHRMIEQLNERESQFGVLWKEEGDRLDQVWTDQKLGLVPGGLLLDAVCRRYGARFKKRMDAKRLASLMGKAEIHDEMKELIGEIGVDSTVARPSSWLSLPGPSGVKLQARS